MNSFTLHAVGQLASDPELVLGQGKNDTTYVRFSLIGNDYAGKGRDEIVTRVFFVAFGGLAEAIGKNACKGDQLILEAQIRAGAAPDVVRLSIGIEDAADIIADLDQALAKAV